jgi:hypothetical protein
VNVERPVVAALQPGHYTLGALLGILALIVVCSLWALRTKPADAESRPAVLAEQAVQAELVDTDA